MDAKVLSRLTTDCAGSFCGPTPSSLSSPLYPPSNDVSLPPTSCSSSLSTRLSAASCRVGTQLSLAPARESYARDQHTHSHVEQIAPALLELDACEHSLEAAEEIRPLPTPSELSVDGRLLRIVCVAEGPQETIRRSSHGSQQSTGSELSIQSGHSSGSWLPDIHTAQSSVATAPAASTIITTDSPCAVTNNNNSKRNMCTVDGDRLMEDSHDDDDDDDGDTAEMYLLHQRRQTDRQRVFNCYVCCKKTDKVVGLLSTVTSDSGANLAERLEACVAPLQLDIGPVDGVCGSCTRLILTADTFYHQYMCACEEIRTVLRLEDEQSAAGLADPSASVAATAIDHTTRLQPAQFSVVNNRSSKSASGKPENSIIINNNNNNSVVADRDVPVTSPIDPTTDWLTPISNHVTDSLSSALSTSTVDMITAPPGEDDVNQTTPLPSPPPPELHLNICPWSDTVNCGNSDDQTTAEFSHQQLRQRDDSVEGRGGGSSISALAAQTVCSTEDGLLQCVRCDLLFADTIEMRQHLQLHSRKSLKCEACGGNFASRRSMLRHRFDCSVRLNQCTTASGFCDVCQRTVPNYSYHLRQHRLLIATGVVGEDEALSVEYDTVAPQSSTSQTTHCANNNNNKRTASKSMAIDRCDKHIQRTDTSTVDTTSTVDISGTTTGGGGGDCGESRGSQHRRISPTATSNPPASCPICGRQFAREDVVKGHIRRVHMKERPYRCGQCGKSFVTTFTRQRHEMIHRNEYRYYCQGCGEGFRQKQQLRTHMKHRHGVLDIVFEDIQVVPGVGPSLDDAITVMADISQGGFIVTAADRSDTSAVPVQYHHQSETSLGGPDPPNAVSPVVDDDDTLGIRVNDASLYILPGAGDL